MTSNPVSQKRVLGFPFMEYINMNKCLNCGYERQPKDEGIVPATECPRCGILYGKIKNGDEGLKDVAGQQHKEGKEFQKDSDTFGSEKVSLTDESKSFPIPKVSILRSALIPFLPTLLWIFLTVPLILRSPEIIGPALWVPVFLLAIIWLRFLRRPYEIVVDHKQLTFKAPLRTVKVNVGDLTSVRDIYGGFFTRFKSKKKSVDAINIREWDELIKIIKSINPAVEIKRYSKVVRMLGTLIYPIFVTFLIYILGMMGMLGYWDITNRAKVEADLAPVIVALEKYKTVNNCYPDKLEALIPAYLDTLPRAAYYVDTSGEYTIGRYTSLLPNKRLYSSRTKTWRTTD